MVLGFCSAYAKKNSVIMRRVCVAVIGLTVFPSLSLAEPLASVDELLMRASKALQEKNYHGRFTYEFGSTLETLEIVHAVKDGVEVERISHLNGLEREFLRRGRREDCVSTGGFLLRGGLISVGGNTISLTQNYHFYIRGDDRIANRNAAVIQVVPKDEYRYGVTLAIDKESGIPLMSLTTNSAQAALERFQFVQLSVGDINLDKALLATGEGHANLDGSHLPCTKPEPAQVLLHPSWLPPGFVLSDSGVRDGDESLTYTDGIASFTLFITAVANAADFKQGVARRGATTALMALLNVQNQLYGAVLVGEVPFATAQEVVASVKYVAK